MNMNKIKGFIAISAFGLLILGLPAIASAQWNGGYGQNGRYGNSGYYNNANLRSAVRNLKDRAKSFEKAADRYDDRRQDRNDRDRWGGWGNNNRYSSGNLENLADQLKDATDDLEDAFGRGRNLNNSESQATRVLNIASMIDREINNTRGSNLRSQWNMMRRDLNIIADAYGMNGNYRGNRSRNRNGGWINNLPFPF